MRTGDVDDPIMPKLNVGLLPLPGWTICASNGITVAIVFVLFQKRGNNGAFTLVLFYDNQPPKSSFDFERGW